jgi:hypothetical protein
MIGHVCAPLGSGFKGSGFKVLGSGFKVQGSRFKVHSSLVVKCWVLDTNCWILVAGYSIPVTGCSMLDTCYLSLFTCHWLQLMVSDLLLFIIMLIPLYITLQICNQASINNQMKEDRGQMSENRSQRTENEVRSRIRRRPIGRDYAAAKDVEVGNSRLWNHSIVDFGLRIRSFDPVFRSCRLILLLNPEVLEGRPSKGGSRCRSDPPPLNPMPHTP